MQDSFGQSDGEQSTLKSIVDQLEELVVTLFEEVRARPAVAAALVAVVVGAVVGSMLASGIGRRSVAPPRRVAKRARGIAQAADLAGMAVKLLQNPLVRGYLASAIQSQVKKRF